MRLFEFASLTLHVDNPGGRWLAGQQAQCKEDGKNSYGAPNRFGPVTASFSRAVLFPVHLLSLIDGVMGEQGRTREDSVAWLKNEMETHNRLPLGSSGNQYKPLIVVDYRGTPWVNEGNHRIKVAKMLGWEFLPVEVRYFSGGEEAKSPLTPDKVKQYDAMGVSAGYSTGDDFVGKITQTH